MLVFDDQHRAAFFPLAENRSVGDLRCGILKLRQRLQQFLEDSDDTAVWTDPLLTELYRERKPEWRVNQPAPAHTLLVNSRLRVDQASIEAVKNLPAGHCLHQGEVILALRTLKETPALPTLDGLAGQGYTLLPSDLELYHNLSDIIHDNDRLLRFDFEHLFYDNDNYFETELGVTALNPYSIWIGENVDLKPGVVLDASDGPIVLDQGARVLANAVITGPAYIGKRSLVRVGAKVYGGTSIGPVCKVGGEVEGSIFQAYSNKQHDGFLGHSFIGEWVNLGADTNNSDLKNTYGSVGFYSYLSGSRVDSGSLFLGALIGDHAKLGINTSINTGCVIGVGSNLWGPHLISGFIPDFSWGQASELESYRFDRFCATATLVKARRELEFSPAETEVFRVLQGRSGV
jgi:UDP-N-acetylglucosamine diphosphorylase/glucosamine-1-phosphate N-acetyltransferase